MSIKIMSAVYDSDLTDIYECAVMLALANHSDDDGRCYPSIRRIAKLARMGERGVQGVIKRLSERGYIEVQIGGGRSGTNVYTVCPNGPETPHPMHPAPHAPPRTPCTTPPHPTTLNPAPRAPETSITVNETSVIKKNTKKKLTQFSEDWMPDEKAIEYCLGKGYHESQIGQLVEDCVNHHRGKGNTFKDHNSAFRTWASNQIKFHGTPERQRSKGQKNDKRPFSEIHREHLAAKSSGQINRGPDPSDPFAGQ